MREDELERRLTDSLERQAVEADTYFRERGVAARIGARPRGGASWLSLRNALLTTAAVLAAVAVGLWGGGVVPLSGVGSAPSPTEEASPSPPERTDAPTTSAAGTPESDVGFMAEVVGGELVAYSEPRTDANVIDRVAEGRVVWVSSEQQSEGQRWLRFQFPSAAWDNQEVFAWTPSGDQLHEVRLACPDVPEVAALGAMSAQEHLNCFGGTQLKLVGFTVEIPPGSPAYAGTPAWIGEPSGLILSGSDTSEADTGLLRLHVNPDRAIDVPRGTWVAVVGHFDDPVAEECHRERSNETLSEESQDEQVLYCQQRFVVERVGVVDAPVLPRPVPSAPGLTEEEAIAVARAAAPHAADFPVTRAEAGLASELVHEPALDLPTLPTPERLVWVIVLAGGPTQNQEISVVVIDFRDGQVYGVLDLIG